MWRAQDARWFFLCARDAKHAACHYDYYGRDGDTESGPDDELGDVDDARDFLLTEGSLRRWVVRADGTVDYVSAGSPSGSVEGATDIVGLGAVIPMGMSDDYEGSRLCGLRATGAVACWSAATMTATDVPGIVDAQQLVSGGAFACIRRAAGGIACWGDRDQLGTGASTRARTPSPVPGVAIR